MTDEQEFFLKMTASVLMSIVFIAITTIAICCFHAEAMAKMGYEEVSIVGQASTVWQKVK